MDILPFILLNFILSGHFLASLIALILSINDDEVKIVLIQFNKTMDHVSSLNTRCPLLLLLLSRYKESVDLSFLAVNIVTITNQTLK